MIDSTVCWKNHLLSDSTVQRFAIFTAVYFPFSSAFKNSTMHLLSQVVLRRAPLGNCKLG